MNDKAQHNDSDYISILTLKNKLKVQTCHAIVWALQNNVYSNPLFLLRKNMFIDLI